MGKKIILLVLIFLYMAFIWIQSSYFNPSGLLKYADYISLDVVIIAGIILELAHLIEFGILYLLCIFFLLTFGKLTMKKEIIAALFSIAYGAVDEVHQIFVPFRSFSIVDLIKNIVGVLIFLYSFRKVYFKKMKINVLPK